MIFGFLKPWSPVFIHFIIPKYFKEYKKNHGDILENIIFHIWEFGKSKMLTFSKRRAPENDDDPSKNFLKILNMGPLSTWKHEMIFGNIIFG